MTMETKRKVRRYAWGGGVVVAVILAGVGGAYYYPLARTVIGGLTTSTILTLVILPFIYTLVDDVAVWLKQVWRRGTTPARVAAPVETAS